jgi:D-sedoheptulose 7-phosphate isomerase
MNDNFKTNIIEQAFARHFEVFQKSLGSLVSDANRVAEMLGDVARNNRHLLICGNGGSAADAQHFAAEWVCKYKKDRKPLNAIALTVNTSALTAIGNDYGFENIFSRQIEALGKVDDLLIVITTSGTSPNILEAIKKAKLMGLRVVALTGEGGKRLSQIVDIAIIVPTSETARIQEVHELIYHAWCEYIDTQVNF